MRRTERLKKEALESCDNRDHDMKKFQRVPYLYFGEHIAERDSWHSECKNCGMEVTVNPCPLPNEVDIGGEAVALNCKS